MVRITLTFLAFSALAMADSIQPLKEALQKQAKHQSVVVTFRQTKKSPALADEIKTMGKLWLVPGKSFRWELGRPAKKTVIFNGGDVLVLNETEKTAERFPPDHKTVKPLFLTLGMGEDSSFDGLTKLFTIRGTNQAKGRFVATFSPKPRQIRKMIKSLLMQVNLESSYLEIVSWVQRDGTEVKTEFFTPTLNQTISKELFEVEESRYTWK
jgi:outer membrane lipoprotein-sorting protein